MCIRISDTLRLNFFLKDHNIVLIFKLLNYMYIATQYLKLLESCYTLRKFSGEL